MSDIENKVKKMYKDYPYPQYRKEWDDNCPLPRGWNPDETLSVINHYCFKGKKKFDNFRVLVAGCGTGNDLIWIAKQLELYKNTSVTGIDLSGSSIDITKKRIKLYNLNNVELHKMSLLDLKPETFGLFDFILCTGVLHHLENPAEGLISLKNVLNETGALYIMVYGQIGRTHIYQMQDLLKLINKNQEDIEQKINNFKIVYNHLPENNLFKKNEDLATDHKSSKNGIVDMLLHPQDRAFTIPELFKWIKECELHFIEFGIPERGKYKYQIPNIDYSEIEVMEQYAINELYFSDIIKHIFYVSKASNTAATIEDLDNIPIWVGFDFDQCEELFKYFEKSSDYNASLNCQRKELLIPLKEKDVKFNYNRELNVSLSLDADTLNVIKNIDNKRSLREIFDIVINSNKCRLTFQQLAEKSAPLFNKLIDELLIVLKHPDSDLKLAKWKFRRLKH